MCKKIIDFNKVHYEKLKLLSREERAKAGLKKLAQEFESNKDKNN